MANRMFCKMANSKPNQNECKSVIDSCESNNRIMDALKHYSSLDLNSELDRNDLVKYCYDQYISLLAGYIHVVEIHNTKKDLTDISVLLASQHQLHECNISNCFFLPVEHLDVDLFGLDSVKNVIQMIKKQMPVFTE